MPKVTQQVGDRAGPGIGRPNSQLKDQSPISLCPESSSSVPTEERQCPCLGLRGGVACSCHCPHRKTCRKCKGCQPRGLGGLLLCPRTHIFHPSPHPLGRNSLIISLDPWAYRQAPCPSLGLFPQQGGEHWDKVISQLLTCILWLSRSPARFGHQHPFFLEGLRHSVWIQVRGDFHWGIPLLPSIFRGLPLV